MSAPHRQPPTLSDAVAALVAASMAPDLDRLTRRHLAILAGRVLDAAPIQRGVLADECDLRAAGSPCPALYRATAQTLRRHAAWRTR